MDPKILKMEEDPDGCTQQVAVIMTGQVYRDAGLQHSKHPVVEGLLYDKLCKIGKHKLRDEVRRMALSIAISVSDHEFKPTVTWLDNFMRRFCLSKKKMGFHSSAMLKQKGVPRQESATTPASMSGLTQKEVFNALGINLGNENVNKEGNKTEATLLIENGNSEEETANGQDSPEIEMDVEKSLRQGQELHKENDKEMVEESKQKIMDNSDNQEETCINNGTRKECRLENEPDISSKNEEVVIIPSDNENESGLDDKVGKETDLQHQDEIKQSDPDFKFENGMEVIDCTEDEKTCNTGSVNEGEEVLSQAKMKGIEGESVEKEVELHENKDENDLDSDKMHVTDSENGRVSSVSMENEVKAVETKIEPDSSNDTEIDDEKDTSNLNESDDGSSSDNSDCKEAEESQDAKEDEVEEEKKKSRKEDEVIIYSKEETKYYRRNLAALQKRLSESVMRCTSCTEQVNHQIRGLVFTHPVLGVFLCKRCRKYYGKGTFCKDEEGYDEYCRLCAEGGDLLCCEQENCFNGFCKRCVKRTLGRSELKKVESTENWACYVCDPSPMTELRALHRAILDNLDSSEKLDDSMTRKELSTKKLKNKFDLLKRRRIEKSQKDSHEKKVGKGNEKEIKCDIAKDKQVTDDGAYTLLREAIDNMAEMLSLCLSNVKTIDSKWSKCQLSEEATEKAGKRILKQLRAMRFNFELIETKLASNLEKFSEGMTKKIGESAEKSDEQEHNSTRGVSTKDLDDDGGSLRKVRKREENVNCGSGNENCQASVDKKEENETCKLKKSRSETTDCVNDDNAAHQKIEVEECNIVSREQRILMKEHKEKAKSDKSKSENIDVDLISQDSSKALFRSDDENSLPNLEDAMEGILSDGSNDFHGALVTGADDEVHDDEAFSENSNKQTGSNKETGIEKDCQQSELLEEKKGKSQEIKEPDDSAHVDEEEVDQTSLMETSIISVATTEDIEAEPLLRSRSSRKLGNSSEEHSAHDDVDSEAEHGLSHTGTTKRHKKGKASRSDGTETNYEGDKKIDIKKANESIQKESLDSEESGVEGKIGKENKTAKKDKFEDGLKKKNSLYIEGDDCEKKIKKGDFKDDGEDEIKKESTEDDIHVEEDRVDKKKVKQEIDENVEEDAKVKKTQKQEEKGAKSKKGKIQMEDDQKKEEKEVEEEDEGDLEEEEEGGGAGINKEKSRDAKCKDDRVSEKKGKSLKKRRRKRKDNDDEDEDINLGLADESSGSADNGTDQEMSKEECKNTKPVKKKKKREVKVHLASEEDGEDVAEMNKKQKTSKGRNKREGKNEKVNIDEKSRESPSEEHEDVKEEKLRKLKGTKKKEQTVKGNKENEEALSMLLASDSDEGDATKRKAQDKTVTNESRKMIVSESSEASEESSVDRKKRRRSESSASEVEKVKVKRSKDCKSPVKTDNQRAKAALLESESEDDLEDKPKPRCKKKNYRKSSRGSKEEQSLQHCKQRRKILTEEEREELKEKQLKSKCQVEMQELSSVVKEKLDDDEYVDVTDFPEFDNKNNGKIDSDDCDADEEDSDKEFSKLMNFNVNRFSKPAPKSKKKYVEPEEEDEVEEADKDRRGEGNESSKKEKKEGLRVVKKKKEGLLDISIDKEDEDDDEEEEEEDKKKKKKKDGGITLNEKMKKQILLSSDEEEDTDEEEVPKDDKLEEEKERKKYEEKKRKKEEEKKKQENGEDSNDEYVPKVYKKGYMNLNISSDENDAQEEEDEIENGDDDDDDDDDEDYDSDFEESPRKKRAFQISSSDSDDDKKKKKKATSTDSDSEEELEEKPKAKRKRIKKMSSSDDDDDGDGDDDDDNEEGKSIKDESPSKHKKIRRVIRDEDLMETTKNATQEEEERRKRVAERQKQYNQIFEIDVESDQKNLGKLVLDFNPETKAELISINEKLVKFLKPHQFKGIKFMWDATIESLEMLKSKPGSGCILAHCMGLGKTLQVIAFTHSLLTNKNASRYIQRVMVCCPVNTVYNWVSEFNNWLKGKMLPFDIIELVSAKDLWGRAYRLDDWWREGGVCIMGYDMFRNLSNSKSKRFKGKMKEIFQKTLINPGPDLMVCDEGHILKNEKTALSIAINQIKCKRRIVLTGTPLQNNLKEYHCMIQFVKPNLLGTKKEFMNRFVNPIEQGQCADAMPRDVRRMKRRAHILHNLLEGCVQRFDYTVLKPFLPPKFEYVVSVQLSEIQCKLYQYYLDNLAQGGPKRQSSGLFVDFSALSRVWTHPKVLELAVRRALFEDDDDEEMADFICDDTTTSESSDDERSRKKKKPEKKKKNNESGEEDEVNIAETEKPGPIPGLTESGKVRIDWWKKVLLDNVGEDFEEDDYLDKLEHSGKLILLLEILRECTSIGDKVLLFSQSLLALDMIEDFLQLIDEGSLDLPQPDDPLPLPFKQWKKERDYLRLDGSTSADTRKNLCKTFNNPSNERCRLFIISTRAGGLGINLVAANRVIIFDSSWNPSHDTQSIFRVYRFGQKKPCYIYRFVAQGTMEEKIYSRQVTKMSTSLRVVDEHQIKRYFKMEELAQLYEFNPADVNTRETPIVPEDRLLAELLKRQKKWIVDYHEHDSLLENQTSEELTEEERKAAWEDYENEKKGFMVQNQRNSVMTVVSNPTVLSNAGVPSLSLSSFSFEGVVNTIKAQNPNLSQQEMVESVVLATKQIQKIHLNHYQRVQGMVYNLKNPMIAPEQRKLLPFGNHPEMLPMLEQQLRMLEENIQRENQVINHMTQISPHRDQVSMANLMSAGLIRGQPASTGISSATANYVTRPVSTATSSLGQTLHQPQQKAPDKKTGSNDVIMLD
ncbi:uncharacterized protein [Panulirus ornatus]|uniref:uncharacterized protein n=1 Tax=Panulirus ornatus TaxID=150431 RepID=UPI003A86EFE1